MTELAEKYNLDVVYEDNHIIIINKKPGQIAQADKTGDVALNEMVKNYIKEKYNKPGKGIFRTDSSPGPTHQWWIDFWEDR